MGMTRIDETPPVSKRNSKKDCRCNSKEDCQCDQFQDIELQEEPQQFQPSVGGSLQIEGDNENQENSINNADTSNNDDKSCCKRVFHRIVNFYFTQMFSIHLLVGIALAKAYPPLGADYLAPDITASWLAVALIFFISGLGIRADSLLQTFRIVHFHAFLQIFNFFFISAVFLGVAEFLAAVNVFDRALADGLTIAGCLPMAVNAIIVFSVATGADEPAAIFNATFSNILGIFLSPVLILLYVGAKNTSSPLGEVFWKLILRVVVPLFVGQCVQKLIPAVKPFYSKYKSYFKRATESCLVFIIYTVFCTTFKEGNPVPLSQVFSMLLCLIILSVFFMVLSWYMLKLFFRNQPELRIVGFVGGSQKTISLGVPLIASMYQGNVNVGLYTLPILIYHPLLLFLTSILIPQLTEFIKRERHILDSQKTKEVIFSSDSPEIRVEELNKKTIFNESQTHQDTTNSDDSSV